MAEKMPPFSSMPTLSPALSAKLAGSPGLQPSTSYIMTRQVRFKDKQLACFRSRQLRSKWTTMLMLMLLLLNGC
eukprot:6461767-Amphidinium_carterae.1